VADVLCTRARSPDPARRVCHQMVGSLGPRSAVASSWRACISKGGHRLVDYGRQALAVVTRRHPSAGRGRISFRVAAQHDCPATDRPMQGQTVGQHMRLTTGEQTEYKGRLSGVSFWPLAPFLSYFLPFLALLTRLRPHGRPRLDVFGRHRRLRPCSTAHLGHSDRQRSRPDVQAADDL
jgi:hypothetical protein